MKQRQRLLQFHSKLSSHRQLSKRIWSLQLSPYLSFGFVRHPSRKGVCSASHFFRGWNNNRMRKWPRNDLYIFCWNCKVPTENRLWISKNPDSNTKRKFHPSYSMKNVSLLLQGCSTSDRHLVAAGTDENKPEIHIWEKKVSYKIYVIQISWIEIYELRRRRHIIDKILVGDTIPLFFWYYWISLSSF